MNQASFKRGSLASSMPITPQEKSIRIHGYPEEIARLAEDAVDLNPRNEGAIDMLVDAIYEELCIGRDYVIDTAIRVASGDDAKEFLRNVADEICVCVPMKDDEYAHLLVLPTAIMREGPLHPVLVPNIADVSALLTDRIFSGRGLRLALGRWFRDPSELETRSRAERFAILDDAIVDASTKLSETWGDEYVGIEVHPGEDDLVVECLLGVIIGPLDQCMEWSAALEDAGDSLMTYLFEASRCAMQSLNAINVPAKVVFGSPVGIDELSKAVPALRRAVAPLLSGSFRWPSTDAYVGGGSMDELFVHQQGLLSAIGYKVGRDGVQLIKRRDLLDSVFRSELPSVNSPQYMAQWGKPNTAQRLRKLAESLAAFVRNAKGRARGDWRLAISDWESDLAYIKDQYYVGRFDFPWPSTSR